MQWEAVLEATEKTWKKGLMPWEVALGTETLVLEAPGVEVLEVKAD